MTRLISARPREQDRLIRIRGLPMFQELIDDYRRQAARYLADAIEIEAGRWLAGDQSSATAASRRGLAAMLLELADGYEALE